MLSDQLFETIVHDYHTVEVEDVHEIKAANIAFAKGKKYAVLVDSGMITSVSKEARELTASKDFQMDTLAKALLVQNAGHRLVGKFYIKINKPYIKTKIFANRDEALAWLQSEISKVNSTF